MEVKMKSFAKEEANRILEETIIIPEQFEKDYRSYCLNMIKNFNNTLKSGEKKRYLLSVIITDRNKKCHVWEKSSLTSIIEGGRILDTYKCIKCNITGKRYGISGTIVRDQRYAKYEYCKG